MKKSIAAFCIFLLHASLPGAGTLYSGLSYTQRAILEIGGNETPVTIHVRDFGNRTAMQMESPLGMLCRLLTDTKGELLLIEASPMFRESWARNFVLRDLLVVTGKKSAQEAGAYPYSVTLGDYKFFPKHNRLIPQSIEISDARYSIRISTLGIRE